MDAFENRYFKLNRKMLWLFGVWHTQTYRERLIRYCVVGSALLYGLFLQLCELLTLDFELRLIVPLLQTCIPVVCFTLLYFTSVIHYMTLQKLYNYMKQDWQRLKDDIELKIMERYANQSKLFTLICGIMFCLFVGLFILPPILLKIVSSNKARSITDRFPIYSCLDSFLDPETYYYPILIHEIVIVLIVLSVALTCYSTYFWVIQHVCARLSIMKGQINRPFINSHPDDHIPIKPMDLSHWVIDIIQRLSRTREFMTLVNTLSEKCYLIQIMLAFLLLIIDFICLFQMPVLLEHEESRKDAIMFIIFIFTTLFPIYVNCYVGQRLMDYSVDVYKEACLVPIHEMSLKTQKLLLTMLTMNAKPLVISVGKVFVSSHEFFSDLLRTSLSFAMVVHSMQNM